jgi:hypothetical protein
VRVEHPVVRTRPNRGRTCIGLSKADMRKESGGERIHQIKLRSTDMGNKAKPGRLPLDDVDARILGCLSHEPFTPVRSTEQARRSAGDSSSTLCHIPGHAALTFLMGPLYVNLRIEGQAGECALQRFIMSSASKRRLTFGSLSLGMSDGYSSTRATFH